MEQLFDIGEINENTDFRELRDKIIRKCLHCGTKSYSKPLCSTCYRKVHVWAKKNILGSLECGECKITFIDKKIEAANISQEYKYDMNDWEYLCRKCHSKKYKIEKFLTLRRYLLIEELDNIISMKETGLPTLTRIFKDFKVGGKKCNS